MLRNLNTLSGGMGVCGTYLVGVPASELPTGFPLTGLLNNDVDAADPVDCLYRVEVVDRPSAGVLTIEENGAFSFTGAPDGTYAGPLTNYKNDVPMEGTYRFVIGAPLPAVVTGVSVAPTNPVITGLASQQFSAVVNGDNSPPQEVVWSKTGDGTLSASGLFTAPAASNSDQGVTITATSVFDNTKMGSTTVTVPAVVVVPESTVTQVTISPTTANGSQQFHATVNGTNSPSQEIIWSLSGAGSLTNTGLFIEPAKTDSVQIITITATSVQDGTMAASATVTIAAAEVVNPPVSTVTLVTVLPAIVTINGSGTQQFTASVMGINGPSQDVIWSVDVGTITVTGLYTAPASTPHPQTTTVRATSVQDESKFGMETFNVMSDGTLVHVAPNRILRTVAGNMLLKDGPVVEGDTYYLRQSRWYINKDVDDILYYALDVEPDLLVIGTEVLSVEPVVEGVVLIGELIVDGALLIALVSGGGDLYDDAENFLTFRITCTNGEVFDRTMHFMLVPH